MKKTLSQYREEKGFTQADMAKELGISVPAYSMYENGKRNIPANMVSKIKKILAIDENAANDIFLPNTFAICKTKLTK